MTMYARKQEIMFLKPYQHKINLIHSLSSIEQREREREIKDSSCSSISQNIDSATLQNTKTKGWIFKLNVST